MESRRLIACRRRKKLCLTQEREAVSGEHPGVYDKQKKFTDAQFKRVLKKSIKNSSQQPLQLEMHKIQWNIF